MDKTDVLVIGGSAAGIVAATTGRSFYPQKDFMVIRKEKQVLVPCGIPYIFGTLDGSGQNLVPNAALEKAGVELRIAESPKIDRAKKTCSLKDGGEIGYEKLILATGSIPSNVGWLKGSDLQNVFSIPKDKEYLDRVQAKLADCENVAVIGGGFIGVELADELRQKGKNVTIIELMPHILSLAFDEELAIRAEEVLRSRGVDIKAGSGVDSILGDGKASGVRLQNGEEIAVDAVILAMGYRPNSGLAQQAGLKLADKGFIKVNEYMQTEDRDILAVGDCAEKLGFLTRTPKPAMLASTACAEARIAGMNLYSLSRVRSFSGTLSIFSTAFGNCAMGAAGLTESLANERGFDVITGSAEGIDHHPGTLPGTAKQFVKLIATKEGGILLGGEVIGGASTGELVNLLGIAIQNHMTVNSLLSAQIGTHPLLTAPPTAYPLIKAAEAISAKRRAMFTDPVKTAVPA